MIFRRTLQREFTQVAAAVFVTLVLVAVTVVLIRLLGQVAGGGVPADAVLALIGFGVLTNLPVVLTVTAFLGVLLALSRVWRDSEMVVWFASGQPLSAWISPVLRFAIPLMLLTGCATLFLCPWAFEKSHDYKEKLESRDDVQVAPGVFRESAGAARVFFGEASKDGRVRNVFVSEEKDGKLIVVGAETGVLKTDKEGDRYVVLEHGRRYEGRPGSVEYRIMEFDRAQVRIETNRQSTPYSKTRGRSTFDLLEQMDANNLSELGYRINSPLATLFLALLAIPLSFVNPRAGRTNSLLLAILICLIYNNAILLCQNSVSKGNLSFVSGLILPHLVVLPLFALLFYRRSVVTPFWYRRREVQKTMDAAL
ncbi:MAG: LPS export ABC transporter permease LptF [Azoarcus sp.]|jgi:lipopolysaccharide export system permease protein|nr:LPS export ABC transporter permease LptF [Azoarcus sp.]